MDACSGVTLDSSTALVSPFSPCVRVHHSSYSSYVSLVQKGM